MRTFLALLLSASTCGAALWHQDVSIAFVRTPGTGKNIELTTNAVSISMWFKIRADYTGGSVAELISKGITTGGSQITYNVRLETNNLKFRYESPDSTFHIWVPSATTQTSNAWQHVGVTFLYGTGTSMCFYLDGVQRSGTWTDGNGNAPGLTNTQDFQIAGQAFGASMIGFYDEVAVWSTILSPQQMITLAKSRVKRMPLSISPSTLVVYFGLDDYRAFRDMASGEAFVDSGPNRNRGKMFGASPFTLSYSGILSYPPNE